MILLGFESKEDLENRFEIRSDEDTQYIAASYNEQGWIGYAFVLYRFEGQLYEVNASHPIGDFLSGDLWDPEPCDTEVLRSRKAHFGFSDEQWEEILNNI